jgi:hypothetical protein
MGDQESKKTWNCWICEVWGMAIRASVESTISSDRYARLESRTVFENQWLVIFPHQKPSCLQLTRKMEKRATVLKLPSRAPEPRPAATAIGRYKAKELNECLCCLNLKGVKWAETFAGVETICCKLRSILSNSE